MLRDFSTSSWVFSLESLVVSLASCSLYKASSPVTSSNWDISLKIPNSLALSFRAFCGVPDCYLPLRFFITLQLLQISIASHVFLFKIPLFGLFLYFLHCTFISHLISAPICQPKQELEALLHREWYLLFY